MCLSRGASYIPDHREPFASFLGLKRQMACACLDIRPRGPIMTRVSAKPRARVQSPFELRTLTALSCGCVIADFHAQTMDVELVSVEAQGPHCDRENHRSGQVLGLGGSAELDTHQLDMLAATQTAA